MRHPGTAYMPNFQFVHQNSMNRGLRKFEVTCQLTNKKVWIVFNSCGNSVNVNLRYRGAFPSTVFWIQNGQLVVFFKLAVQPKNCLPREQSISMHAVRFIEHLRSHQAESNTILHNKPLFHLRCHGEACCRHIPIITPFGACFAHSSVTQRLLYQLRCMSALLMRK